MENSFQLGYSIEHSTKFSLMQKAPVTSGSQTIRSENGLEEKFANETFITQFLLRLLSNFLLQHKPDISIKNFWSSEN